MVPVLDDVENFFIKLKIQIKFRLIVLTTKLLSSINILQNIWSYSKSYQFYAVVGSADKDPHSIDKLSNLADSRRYLRNALPPYICARMTKAIQRVPRVHASHGTKYCTKEARAYG